MTQAPDKTVRRRTDLRRTLATVIITAVVLILFVVWYKAYPHKLDCQNTAQQIADYLNTYRQKYQSFPIVIDEAEIERGRFPIDHFTYRFSGMGADAHQPDGTIVVYCRAPHRTLFRESGRHVLKVEKDKIVLQWIPEDEFQRLLKQQSRTAPV